LKSEVDVLSMTVVIEKLVVLDLLWSFRGLCDHRDFSVSVYSW
jgi:hypothetical protein